MTANDPSSHRMRDTDYESGVTLIRDRIRAIPDFPKPGILFRDITTVLADAEALRVGLQVQLHNVADLAGGLDVVVAIESRGFIYGMAMAERLGLGFVPVRKPGKLPAPTEEQTYDLEYGTDTVQVHRDALSPGQRVLVVDDLLATGGTAGATCELIEKLGTRVAACSFLIELEALGGRARLGDRRVESVVRY
jgi:adenine phosphoribosyltransferase